MASALAASVALLLTASGSSAPAATADRALGWRVKLGNGEVGSFAEVQETGAPRAIGIMISADALASLPSEPSDHHHCFDRNGDGITAHAAECAHSHEFVIPLPDAVNRRGDIPFKWVLLNWNAHGHVPPGVYDVPHFDVHFYMAPIADIFAIRDGTCGPEFVNCDDFAVAKTPVPAGLMHPDFSDVDAVVPAMGNHLIDLSGREFQGEPFTRSWIYGVYGGRVIFYEEMVALAFLRSRPDACSAIKSPPAVAVGGFYPTERCVRYDAGANAYVVSMEGFVYREAS
ncbi:MAG: hypothetical protein H0V51_07910 [Chloroflexi bacterium]|nr:hypothetical protein [Chloroflexota bacterium]